MIASILGFWKIVASLAAMGAAGAFAAIVGRFLPITWAAVIGAVIVGITAYATDNSTNSALKAQNAALRAKQTELVLTTRALEKSLSEALRASEANSRTMASLREKLAATPDRPDCVIDKGVVDELNKIR